jgi:DNA polymerase-3 subunit gamma/tau
VTTALYRRYRPESFAEVIGQEQVTGPLSIALSKNRVNHAYLFSGPRGCGKTTSARILARCLNCADGPTPTPCGVCASCVELARGGPGSLDVVEIDAASHGGVDDARDLRERAAFAPVRDRYKVFIIDEAHMVSPQGFNALLKIVEEPPEHIRFIFATTEPEKVIGTIRSRTHHYPFRLVPPERLTTYLAELCEREGVSAGKGVLPLVVRSGGGSVRDSLSVLDQLIGGSGDDGLTYATAVALLGYTDIALLDDVTDALAAGDGATVFRVIDRVIESGHDPRRFVEDLLERMRDLLVVAALRDGGHAVFRGLPDDQLERMRSQAARFGAAELSRAADVTNAALTEMTGATSPRLQLELLCARLLLPSVEEGERGLAARLDRLEKRINVAGGVVAAPAPVGPPASVARPAAAPVSRPSGPVVDPSAPVAPVAQPVATGPAASGPASSGPAASGGSGPSGQAWPEPVGAQGSPAPAPRPASPEPAAPAAPAPAAVPMASGSGDLEAVRRMWTEVLNALASIKRTTWSLVSQYAQVLDYDGKRLLLGFDSAGRAQSFGRGAHPDFLRQALIDVIGLDCKVEAMASSDFRSGPSISSAPAVAPPPPRPAAPAQAPVQAQAPAQAPRETPREQAAPEPSQPPRTSAPHWTTPQAAPTAPTGTIATAAPPAPRPARSQPARPAARPPADPGARRSSVPASPYDDIPPSLDEPPAEDELPPDDGRPAPNAWPKATRPPAAPVREPVPAPVPVPVSKSASVPEPTPARAAAPTWDQAPAASTPAVTVPAGPTPPPPATQTQAPTQAPTQAQAPVDVVDLTDEMAGDDADYEGAHLVGAKVVQDVLGGRVIEDQ